jgi:hypothetical protein
MNLIKKTINNFNNKIMFLIELKNNFNLKDNKIYLTIIIIMTKLTKIKPLMDYLMIIQIDRVLKNNSFLKNKKKFNPYINKMIILMKINKT